MRSILLILSALCIPAQPPLTTAQYVGQQFGVMYSFGMAVFCCHGNENATVPTINTFNPSSIDVDAWVNTAANGGANYVILTSKYHMGFALFPRTFAVSGFTPFDIAHTSWYANNGNYDIIGHFVQRAQRLGLRVGLYYSVLDHNFENQTGTNATTNPSGYTAMVESDLHDLLTHYGPIDAIWFDGWYWAVGYSAIPFNTLANYVHSLQPGCLVIDNNHLHNGASAIDIYEYAIDGLPPSGNSLPSEFDIGIQHNPSGVPDYSYSDLDAGVDFPASQLVQEWFTSNQNNAAFLINFGPDLTGNLPSDQVAAFDAVIDLHRTASRMSAAPVGQPSSVRR